MNLSMLIIICEEREEVSAFLREMLTKHGFFHLLELQEEELVTNIHHDDHQFLLLNSKFLSARINKIISNKRNFLIFSQPDDEKTIHLANLYGAKHILSFPYSSKTLIEKISQLMI